MSYTASAPFYFTVTGAVVTSATPVDLATGYLPYAGHFDILNVVISMAAGSGIGANPTFTLNTGFSGVGAVATAAALTPTNLNSSSGVNLFANQFSTNYFNGSQLVVRQTTNAGVTGVLAFQVQVVPVF